MRLVPEDDRASAFAVAGPLPQVPEGNRASTLVGAEPIPPVPEDDRTSGFAEAGRVLAWAKQAEAFGTVLFSRSKTSALTFDMRGAWRP